MEAGQELWRWAENQWSALRGRDRYFKAQAAIVFAWALVSLTSIAVVFTSGRTENQLGAEVRTETAVGGPVLFVSNTSREGWTDITYTLNGSFVARQAGLSAGDHFAIPLKRFRRGGVAGKRPPRDLVPSRLAIRCEQGKFDTALTVLAPPP